MCGILGVFATIDNVPDDARFEAALERLSSRGPDDSGVWRDRSLVLGHRRLAVIELSPAGHQPMPSSDGRHVIVFNGEIYNHRDIRRKLGPSIVWRGGSDTETLLEAYRAWGARCVDELNGMFAFAIWDRVERRLFLARDRLGVKPLYYAWNGRRLAFASRPGALALVVDPADLDRDPEALRLYLELGYIPAPLSFHRGIRKLPPAHHLTVDERGFKLRRYWDFRPIVVDRSLVGRTEESLCDELDALIDDAVRVRLISDVPLGAFLSGGVDSARVVAGMCAVGQAPVQAFTISFAEPAYDEGPAAAAIARDFGVVHVTEKLSVDELLGLMPRVLREFDEPLADSSAFPTMAVARLARRHVTVALTGDGGDELFGGYHYYGLVDRLQSFARWPAGLRRMAGALLARWPSHRARLLAGALDREGTAALYQYLRSMAKDFPALIDPGICATTHGAEGWMAQSAASFAIDLTPAEIGMRLDAAFTLVDLYLQKVDVATMAYSLEARSPMMDYRLVEWAMRLPAQWKLRGGQTKYLLKQSLGRRLPPAMVHQPKKGFAMPVAAWLRGPLKAWALERIHDATLMQSLPLARDRVIGLFEQHVRGERDAHPLLWSVLMLLGFEAEHGRRALPEPRRRAA